MFTVNKDAMPLAKNDLCLMPSRSTIQWTLLLSLIQDQSECPNYRIEGYFHWLKFSLKAWPRPQQDIF